MFSEAIILAGGKGTRLRSVYSEGPKPMVPVNGVPFLSRLMGYLVESGVEHIILATGYMHQTISDYYGSTFGGCRLTYSVETKPLGTGGAIAKALRRSEAEDVLVVNGDSFFNIDIKDFYEAFKKSATHIHLALKRLPDVARYGTVRINELGEIISFNEKGNTGEGLINGGVYAMSRNEILNVFPEGIFSFEHDFMSLAHEGITKRGQEFDADFIDIGTPESLKRAGDLFV